MVKLLIIADDFTGALDTGVKLASAGAKTRVITDCRYDISQVEPDVEVLVMDGETRHLTVEGAYDVVYHRVERALQAGIPYIYKKTDSALRGNVGSELAAVLDAAGKGPLHFIPAFPQMNRVTRGGVHYAEGVPIHESVFGGDPFEPVTCSYIPDLIKRQSDIPVMVLDGVPPDGRGRDGWGAAEEIHLYNVETDEQIHRIAEELDGRGELRLMAGCAGFASVLPRILGLERERQVHLRFKDHFLVACGSLNPITRSQLDYGEAHGFYRIRLSPVEKLERGHYQTEVGRASLKKWIELCMKEPLCILDTNDYPDQGNTLSYAKEKGISLEELRVRISSTLGFLLREILEAGALGALLITGGDSLLGFMGEMGVCDILPVCEMAPGTVLSRFCVDGNEYEVISKSGGFGGETLLLDLAGEILGKEKEGIRC